MIDYATCIQYLRPGSQFSITDNDPASIVWHEVAGDPPTQEELAAVWPQALYELQCDAVTGARKLAYGEHSDPFFFMWQRGEATKEDWLEEVEVVRRALPWPERPL